MSDYLKAAGLALTESVSKMDKLDTTLIALQSLAASNIVIAEKLTEIANNLTKGSK